MILHHAALYRDLADPLPLFRDENYSGQLRTYWAYADPAQHGSPASRDVIDYTQLMSASQESVAEQVLATIDLGGVRHLLDVGGGNASFAIAAAARWPELRVTVADLPAVAELAQQRVASLGLGDRITAVAVDFTATSLPTGHDAVSLVRILHDHDDPVVKRLLHAARASLPDHGSVFVAEPLAEKNSAGRLLEVYFNLYLLAMGQGRLRRYSELKSMLEEAGFAAVRRLKTRMPLITSVMSGRCSGTT
jgi:demethylspheroidene O-methyltransferase